MTRFDAGIVHAHTEQSGIVLDRTLFYPASGGQPHDLGTLGGIPLREVVEDNGEIWHILSHPFPLGTQHVEGVVDWPRRYDHMQQHTGQHLLSAVLQELFGLATLSFHMGEDAATIELEGRELTDLQMEQAEERAAQLIAEARPVNARFEDATEATGLRKASARMGTLRVVEIEGIDRSACGGTHVRSTAELGLIQIRGRDRVRGNVRIQFVCGRRARRQARSDHRLLTGLASEAGVQAPQLASTIHRLRERGKEADTERQKLIVELAGYQARAAYSATPQDPEGFRFVKREVQALDDEARAFANAMAPLSRVASLLTATEPSSVLLAVSEDSGWHAGERLKKALAACGGRGGGSARLAQGTVPPENVDELARQLGFAPTRPET